MSKSKKRAKTEIVDLIALYKKDKAEIAKFDVKIAKNDNIIEPLARKQGGLVGKIFFENLVEVVRDENGKITELTFKEFVENDIKKKVPKNGERKDLLITTPLLRVLLPKCKERKENQVLLERKKQIGYALLAVIYEHTDWKACDFHKYATKYQEDVLENGYSKLAKKGRGLHKNASAGKSAIESEYEEYYGDENEEYEDGTDEQADGDVDSISKKSDNNNCATERNVKAITRWLRKQKPAASVALGAFDKFSGYTDAIGVALMVHSTTKDKVDIFPIKADPTDVLEQMQRQIAKSRRKKNGKK